MFTEVFIAGVTIASTLVIAITQILKRILRLRGTASVILSLVISALVSLPKLDQGLSYLLFYAFAVALCANGYKKVLNTLKKNP